MFAPQLDTAAEISKAHATVWMYRKRLESIWPTPERIDSLRFAFTEAGEALDAYLRTVPQYARNNHRNMSVPDELADCAMMLCTALPEIYRIGAVGKRPGCSLDGICFAVADALMCGDVLDPLAMIAHYLHDNYNGASMAALVEQRLKRIEMKVTTV